MKKIIFLSILILITIPLSQMSWTIAHAAEPEGFSIPKYLRPSYAPGTYYEESKDDTSGTPYSTLDVWFMIGDIAKLLLSITGMVTVFFIVQAGFNYVTAGGRQEKLDEAKNTLKWAFLGMMTVLFSYALVDFLIVFLTSIDGT